MLTLSLKKGNMHDVALNNNLCDSHLDLLYGQAIFGLYYRYSVNRILRISYKDSGI